MCRDSTQTCKCAPSLNTRLPFYLSTQSLNWILFLIQTFPFLFLANKPSGIYIFDISNPKKHHNLTFQREPGSEPELSKESQRCRSSNQKEKFLANLSGSHWLSLAHSPTLFGSHWHSLPLFDSLWLSPAHVCSLISLIYSPCSVHKALAWLTAQLPRWRTLSQSAFWKACISLNAKQL